MHRPSRKVLAVSVAGVIVVCGAGASALGFWSGAGSGSTAIPVGAGETFASTLTLNQTSKIGDFGPDVPAQPLSGDFTNDRLGSVPVEVNAVIASISSLTRDGVEVPGCSAADFTITNPVMPVNAVIPVGTNVGSWSGATIAFNNTLRDQDACRNVLVTLSYLAQ
ncbi:MAG: hypothetical protein H7248_10450 [Microbacteriaceae bacterium]|nr:hypothetical protein [Microbacteriaceae bacterium]